MLLFYDSLASLFLSLPLSSCTPLVVGLLLGSVCSVFMMLIRAWLENE